MSAFHTDQDRSFDQPGLLSHSKMSARRLAPLALLVAAGLLVGCAETASRKQLELLYAGQKSYDAGDFTASVRYTTDFIGAHGKGKDASRAYYVRGVANARLGKRPQAYSDLQNAVAIGGDDDAVWRAHTQLGVLYFEDERYDVAVRAFDAALKLMPKRVSMDWVLYRYGQALERIGNWAEARRQFQRIVDEFPSGPVTVNAKRRLTLNADHFAIQCGVYSQKANAAKAAAEFGQAGFPAGLYPEKRPGGDIWVVRIGRYNTWAEAQAALAKVQQQTADAVIWP